MTSSNLGLALKPGFLTEQDISLFHTDYVRESVPTAVGLDFNRNRATNGAEGQTKRSENVSQPQSVNSSPSVIPAHTSCHASSAVKPTVVEVDNDAHALKRRKVGDSTVPIDLSSSHASISSATGVCNQHGDIATYNSSNSATSTSQHGRELSVDPLIGGQAVERVATTQGGAQKIICQTGATHQSLPAPTITSPTATPSEPIPAPQTCLPFVKMMEKTVSNHYVSPYNANSEPIISPEVEKAWQSFTKQELISHVERYRSMLRDMTRKCDKYERERQIWNTRDTDSEKTIPQIISENRRLRKSAIEWRKTNFNQDQAIAALQRMVHQLQQQTALLHQDNVFLAGQLPNVNQKTVMAPGSVAVQQPSPPSQSPQISSTQASPNCEKAVTVTAENVPPTTAPLVNNDAQHVAASVSTISCSASSEAHKPSEIIDLTGNTDIAEGSLNSTSAGRAPPEELDNSNPALPPPSEIPCQPQNEVSPAQVTHPDTTESVLATEHNKDTSLPIATGAASPTPPASIDGIDGPTLDELFEGLPPDWHLDLPDFNDLIGQPFEDGLFFDPAEIEKQLELQPLTTNIPP